MPQYWVEISALAHGHGGPGWEWGVYLWSPADDRRDSKRYEIMREPAPGGIRIAQGLYLGKLTNRLVEIFDVCTGRVASSEAEVQTSIKEYQEGESYRRERTFFARNAALRNDAIKAHGLRCTVCNFHFGETYGPMGEGFIEVHHLEPVSLINQKTGSKPSTSINDVRPLCANCHRMAHRQQPPFSVAELKVMIGRDLSK